MSSSSLLKKLRTYFNQQNSWLEHYIIHHARLIATGVILIAPLIIILVVLKCMTVLIWPSPTPVIQSTTIKPPTAYSTTTPPIQKMQTLLPPHKKQATSSLPYHPPSQPPLWHTVIVKTNDSPIAIFERLGLNTQLLHDILALGEKVTPLIQLTPGKTLHILISNNHKFLKLVYPLNLTDTLYVLQNANGLSAHVVHQQLVKKIAYAQGTVKYSLFTSASRNHISDALVMQLIHIFNWDIDFAKDVQPNDQYKIMYNAYYLNGHPVKDGAIIAAEFTNRHKTYQAIGFDPNTQNDPNTQPKTQTSLHYYTPSGFNLQRAFLRTPVKYTRISSRFQLRRYHPILHLIRAHLGVDYAAPIGTPIHTTGDGKIIFIGRDDGYGNVIIVQHGKHYSTLYGHMDHFAKGMKKYKQVKQGQVIGYVGQTGLATGPHLHYEFRIDGVHHNPLTVKLPKAFPITAKYRAQFKAHAHKIMAAFNTHFKIHSLPTPTTH